MSTQVWIARAVYFLSLLGIAKVVLAGCDTAYGRCEESSGQIHRSTCNCSQVTGCKCRNHCFSAGQADITERATFS